MTPEDVLAWEAENRGRATAAALGSALLTITGVLLTTLGQPSATQFDDRIVTVVDAMGRTAAGQPVPPGRISAYAVDVGNSPAVPIAGAVLYALGSLAIFWVLGYLFRAVRGRRPGFQQFALILAAVGAVGYGLGRGVAEIARYVGAHDFVSSADKSNSAAADALSPPAALIGQIIWQAAALALGFAFVLICLNAMRVGLLTRFMGVLGIIVGVTFVLPLDSQGIIRVFWLAAMGALFAGRWPSGVPKAWATGEAEPWPTQQQLREQRDAARAERDAAQGEGDAETPRASGRDAPPTPPPKAPSPRRPDPAAAGSEHSASKKKKRKRRS
jgi:hypothetical protein